MTERIQKAIDIFLDAVNNGTLAKGNCAACAVGNLVAYGMGAKINPKNLICNKDNDLWGSLFYTSRSCQHISKTALKNPNIIENIESTDFTWQELAKIEFAFETNTKIHGNNYHRYTKEEIRADQIKGLEAVIKVMMTFDDVKADVKELFTNKLEPVTA